MPGAIARTRPLAKSWVRIVASSAASAYEIGMIWSSSCATCTSTSRMMSSRRVTFDAASVMMSTFVSRCAINVPRVEMSGRRSALRSATDEYLIGTICVMISSVVRFGSGVAPTIVGTARSRAPSMRTIL